MSKKQDETQKGHKRTTGLAAEDLRKLSEEIAEIEGKIGQIVEKVPRAEYNAVKGLQGSMRFAKETFASMADERESAA